METNNISYTTIQYNILSGESNGQINNITPGTSGYVLTSNGPNAQPTFQSLTESNYFLQNIQTFSTPGTYTYTPTSGMVYCMIQCQAPGGGGATSATSSLFGGGGGGGGYAQLLASAATIGTSQSITIGTPGSGGGLGQTGFNGGTTSVGALVSCSGGDGGNLDGTNGLGGTGTGGNLNISGQNGTDSNNDTDIRFGGDSYLGFGARFTGLSNPLPAGGQYGGGGLGVMSTSVTTLASRGGPGIVIITEYISI